VITDSYLSQKNGQTKILAGKIVYVLLGTGERARFSLFMQDLDDDNQIPLRFYAFEPIHIMQSKVLCDKQGLIISSDQNFSILFHNTMINNNTNHLNENTHIGDFIPTLKDKNKFKYLLTHRTYRTTGLLNNEKNLFIPLMINISNINENDYIQLIISIMSNISGLIMLDETYTIRAYNPYFIQCLLGYRSLDLINHVRFRFKKIPQVIQSDRNNIGSSILCSVRAGRARTFRNLQFERLRLWICPPDEVFRPLGRRKLDKTLIGSPSVEIQPDPLVRIRYNPTVEQNRLPIL
jgi:hypothetical protein